ncbi:hypothetical protein RIF29_16843 [Crotalaria pallida]|uniref:Uncharacterized protein n=1 Tax=Crotalaria pallida TaxID=3830 RepID=A0AAN9FI45_CROPI
MITKRGLTHLKPGKIIMGPSQDQCNGKPKLLTHLKLESLIVQRFVASQYAAEEQWKSQETERGEEPIMKKIDRVGGPAPYATASQRSFLSPSFLFLIGSPPPYSFRSSSSLFLTFPKNQTYKSN